MACPQGSLPGDHRHQASQEGQVFPTDPKGEKAKMVMKSFQQQVSNWTVIVNLFFYIKDSGLPSEAAEITFCVSAPGTGTSCRNQVLRVGPMEPSHPKFGTVGLNNLRSCLLNLAIIGPSRLILSTQTGNSCPGSCPGYDLSQHHLSENLLALEMQIIEHGMLCKTYALLMRYGSMLSRMLGEELSPVADARD